MLHEDDAGLELGRDLPHEPRVSREPLDIPFIARVQKDGSSGTPEMIVVNEVPKRKGSRVGKVKVIQGGVEPSGRILVNGGESVLLCRVYRVGIMKTESRQTKVASKFGVRFKVGGRCAGE